MFTTPVVQGDMQSTACEVYTAMQQLTTLCFAVLTSTHVRLAQKLALSNDALGLHDC